MLGEGQGRCRRELEPGEVDAIYNHLGLLRRAQLEHEILRKALTIALPRLIECAGFHPVERGQVGIDHGLVATDEQDLTVDALDGNRLHDALARNASIVRVSAS